MNGSTGEVGSHVRREVVWFVGLTFACSAVLWILIVRLGGMTGAGGLPVVALMWTPGLVGLGLQLGFRRSLKGLGWGFGGLRYWLAGYLVPILYAAVAYLAVWASPLGDMDSALFGRFAARPHVLVLGVVVGCLFALGEEIGWRGFLVPRLARLHGAGSGGGFDRTALTSGAIWAVWHYPLILFADYRGGTPVLYSVACFTVLVLGVSYLYTWITLRSGSLWPAVLLHGSHNFHIQGILDRATVDTGPTPYWTGEFGAALALAAVVVALVVRRLPRTWEQEAE